MTRIGRVDLYRLMWTKPGVEVARLLEISGPGLTKLCRRNNVPCPGRGYWRRVEVGKRAIRVPLPEPSADKFVREVSSPEVMAVLAELPSLDAMPEDQSAVTGAPRPSARPAAKLGGKSAQVARTGRSRLVAQSTVAHMQGDPSEKHRQAESIGDAELIRMSADPAGGPRSPAAAVGPTALPPTLSVLFELADEQAQLNKVKELLELVQLELKSAPPACAAVILLWLHLSRAQLADSQPVRRIVDSCNRIASGEIRPGW